MKKDFTIIQGDCLEELDKLGENSVDAIVTDPPYGLTSITKRFGKEGSAPAKYGKDGSFARLSKGFMGKEWDGSGIEYSIETWKKCMRVLKPGGYMLAFGGTRTYHRIACAIEDAGFEIRDCVIWLYGSGFPKSMNIGLAVEKKNGVENIVRDAKQAQNKWAGWGTALKPSYEPIIVARKPFKGSCVDNVMKWGVGGINIDECRISHNEQPKYTNRRPKSGSVFNTGTSGYDNTQNHIASASENGRFPANTILTYDETDFDEVCGGFPNTKSQKTNSKLLDIRGNNYNNANKNLDVAYERGYTDSGSAARYFYCAKASKRDRDEGLEDFEEKRKAGYGYDRGYMNAGEGMFKDRQTTKRNTHPTVKPTSLMQYLIRLVSPKGATILDPFMGSGSTGKAIMFENKDRNAGYKFIGIEKDSEYCDIAQARIEFARESK